MNFILVPFKNFKNAKSRLRKDLSDKETKKIVKLMLEDVLEQVSKSKLGDKKFLLTNDSEAIAWDKNMVLNNIGKQNKLMKVRLWITPVLILGIGASAVLRLPGDVPAISHQDIDEIIHNGKKDNVSVLVPSSSWDKCVLQVSPDVISSSFGENSFEKHMASFIGNDIKFKVMEIENVSIDIDSRGLKN